MKCKLTPITLCHVGSGNTLKRNVDFVADGDKLGIVDVRKIFDIVGVDGIAGWCSAIDRRENILNYVRGYKPNAQLRDICSTVMDVQDGNSMPEKVDELREHIRSLGVPYIPATSLKGALVTAILAANPYDHKLTIPDKIDKNNKIVDKFFSKGDPQTSVLRFLRVSDAYFTGVPTMAMYCNLLNIRKTSKELSDSKGGQYVEVFYTDESAIIDLDIKTEYMETVSQKGSLGVIPKAMTSVRELLKIVNAHTLRLLEAEKDFWSDSDYVDIEDYLDQIDELIDACKSSEEGRVAIIRVGYGSGWDSITGGWSKESANDAEWDRIVNAARPKNKGNYSEYYFPKTRRVFDAFMPLGFMRIEIADK
ncbi:MAG: type III-A CRISPR-associated RAMP protein Csm5 [Alistipes sp.]|nr:type III-A CRISPR-associated RAMP protein Csm5 [Alistipes sp.]